MTARNGTGGRPVVLARYRPGVTGSAARVVHLIPMPVNGERDPATALCGARLRPSDIEIVAVGQGMPCSLCLLTQVAEDLPASTVEPRSKAVPSGARSTTTVAAYQRWGWPVAVDGHQVRLSLAPDAVALIVPIPIATEVTRILTARRCLPPVLESPQSPGYHVLLAGEPYPVALPWPRGTGRITETVLLPPSVTPRGPLRWVCPPQESSLKLCREIDVFAAVRTAGQRSQK